MLRGYQQDYALRLLNCDNNKSGFLQSCWYLCYYQNSYIIKMRKTGSALRNLYIDFSRRLSSTVTTHHAWSRVFSVCKPKKKSLEPESLRSMHCILASPNSANSHNQFVASWSRIPVGYYMEKTSYICCSQVQQEQKNTKRKILKQTLVKNFSCWYDSRWALL